MGCAAATGGWVGGAVGFGFGVGVGGWVAVGVGTSVGTAVGLVTCVRTGVGACPAAAEPQEASTLTMIIRQNITATLCIRIF